MEIFRCVSGSSRRVLKRVDDEVGCVMVCYVPTDNPPCMNLDDGGHIPEAVDEPEVGEISGPHYVWLNGADDL